MKRQKVEVGKKKNVRRPKSVEPVTVSDDDDEEGTPEPQLASKSLSVAGWFG